MKFGNSFLPLAYLSVALLAAAAPANASKAFTSSTTLEEYKARYNQVIKAELDRRDGNAKCNAGNVSVRKEWSVLHVCARF